jgi:predicted dehydrogenase
MTEASVDSSKMMGMTTTRWAMVGTGLMLELIGRDFALVDNVTMQVLVSRTDERAREAQAKFGFPEASGDFEAVIQRDDIDVIYIATPHSEHFREAMAALEAGKHVLVEKPMTTNAADTRALCELAASRGLFAMEAMWTAFNPAIIELRQRVAAGQIGDVNLVQANFCMSFPYQPTARLWDPNLAGGSTLDQGVYPLSFAHMLLGAPSSITVSGTVAHDVDTEVAVTLGYESGARALCTTSLQANGLMNAAIGGSNGSIEIPAPFWSATEFVQRAGPSFPFVPADTVSFAPDGAGYAPMLRAVSAAILDGRTQHDSRSHAETIAVAETMDEVLRQIHQAPPASMAAAL